MKKSLSEVMCSVGGLAAVAGVLFFAGCSGSRSAADLPAAAELDLDRYLGVWYEIARLPHRFERGLCRVSAEYRLNDAGDRILVCNRGFRNGKLQEINGVARFRDDGKANGELEVSFFRPFYGAYRIIRLDPEYRHAVVTSTTRDYLWFLARTPDVSEAEMQSFLRFAKESGFDTAKLEFPSVPPEKL